MTIRTLRKSIIGYKKVYTRSRTRAIAKLRIPKGAKVHSRRGETKRRASEAKVLCIKKVECRGVLGAPVLRGAHSTHDSHFKYRKGETVKPTNGFADYHEVCASGIHFFHTLKQAFNY